MNAEVHEAATTGAGFSGQRTPSDPRLPAPALSNPRNGALDFTKGALVLCMVVYHCFNYFYRDQNVLKYLHFLPPSFIFITGFMITGIYLAKYDPGDARLHGRLFVRGLKLLAIFVGLNLAVNLLFRSNYDQRQLGLASFVTQWETVFLTGGSRAAVFEVLLPISYLLLLMGVLLKGYRLIPNFLQAVAAVTVIGCLILAWQGRLPANLDLLSMGLLGIVAGFVPRPRIDRFTSHLAALGLAYLAYLVVISIWYPTYALNILGICLTLALFYGVGVQSGETGLFQRQIILLGKYSLLAYIVQIGALQGLLRVMRHLDWSAGRLPVALIATSLLMLAAIEAVDYARTKSGTVNLAYKAVFG